MSIWRRRLAQMSWRERQHATAVACQCVATLFGLEVGIMVGRAATVAAVFPAARPMLDRLYVARAEFCHRSFRHCSTPAALDHGKSWRRHGCASGFTSQPSGPNNFPGVRTFLADKFFGPPDPSRCFGRAAVRPARPPPIGSPTRPR